jgi:hypothetical protein
MPAFILLTIEYSVLLTWLYLHTRGSVLIATLCHGAINLSQGLVLGGVDGDRRYWLLAITYGAAALVLAFVLRRNSTQERHILVTTPPVQVKEAPRNPLPETTEP